MYHSIFPATRGPSKSAILQRRSFLGWYSLECLDNHTRLGPIDGGLHLFMREPAVVRALRQMAYPALRHPVSMVVLEWKGQVRQWASCDSV